MFRANPKGNRTQRQVVPKPGILVLSLTLLALVVGACAPGSSVAPPTSTAASTPAATSGASQPAGPSGSATAAGPTCGTSPVVLNAYFETGFDLPFKLSAEFTKQFPNVTWNITQDQFSNLMTSTPRLLAGDNPPDLIRLPTMVSLVKDKLLKNLDDYVTAFGWDKWLGSNGAFVGMHGFGASAPAQDLYKHFGITAEAVAAAARQRIGRKTR